MEFRHHRVQSEIHIYDAKLALTLSPLMPEAPRSPLVPWKTSGVMRTDREKRTRTYGLVTLTFSPGRPRSPTTPGSVTPGRPYIIHSETMHHLQQDTSDMICKNEIMNDSDVNDSDTPSLLWVQAVQLLPVKAHINGWNNHNYLCTEWSLLHEMTENIP